MKNIEINISNKIATLKEKFVGVCGNSDYVVVFDFDDEWKSHAAKTARFKYGGQYTDVVFTGNECPMPIILDTASVEIGVYAGNLHTTTSACALMKTCILSGSGVPADPIPDVYNQIIDKINDGMLKGDKGEDGTNGADGANGADGVTFTPSVDSAGNLSWTNDGGLSNPATVNIKGATGATGERGEQGIPGGYELMEEITIAEGNVSVITRDVDRLCSAKLAIICPPMESIITTNALIYFGDASKPEYIYLFGEIAPTKVGVYRHTTLEAELRNNYWRAYKTTENDDVTMYPNGSWTTFIGETAPSRLMQLPSSNLDAITKITLKAYPTGAYIPVGTKITIYGVRA